MAQTILVTGASGFIAAHVVEAFLRKGYHVRGTVRSERTASHVRESHAKYASQLSLAIVPDMSAPNAFDEAVKGVNGVIHTASPFILGATDYEKELFQPAIQGTTSILEAIQTNNPGISRVVITSSFASVLDPAEGQRPGYTYTEADWNPVAGKEEGSANAVVAYLASKTLAEQAAWKFIEDKKPNFSVSTICPPMVYGPVAHRVDSTKSLNTSSADIYRLFNGSEKEVPDTGFHAFADVRDVAEAHLLAYEKLEAAGQRYLIATGQYTYQRICDIIREKFPELQQSTPKGDTGAAYPESYQLDTSKATQQLGIKFTPLEETITAAVESISKIQT
ncbi:hypothetical protein BGZ63DRAFT_350323 [Mariannaea sp. PMI_226]|nr:hypothetical protein BGZ63DRAFT_350323 [Mariannaea sp. PMI_226]